MGSANAGTCSPVLDTDGEAFGGLGARIRIRIDSAATPRGEGGPRDWRGAGVCRYSPSRSAQVYQLTDRRELPSVEGWSATNDKPNNEYYRWDDARAGGGGDDAEWWKDKREKKGEKKVPEASPWCNILTRVILIRHVYFHSCECTCVSRLRWKLPSFLPLRLARTGRTQVLTTSTSTPTKVLGFILSDSTA